MRVLVEIKWLNGRQDLRISGATLSGDLRTGRYRSDKHVRRSAAAAAGWAAAEETVKEWIRGRTSREYEETLREAAKRSEASDKQHEPSPMTPTRLDDLNMISNNVMSFVKKMVKSGSDEDGMRLGSKFRATVAGLSPRASRADLGHLTPEERSILARVWQKEDEFETLVK
ncbi:hypothetical protein MTO96_010972 [Rhipicephalus appendiculatus]